LNITSHDDEEDDDELREEKVAEGLEKDAVSNFVELH
jgi:hypothetical protein